MTPERRRIITIRAGRNYLPGLKKSEWLGKKDSNLRMPESKSGALTNLATPQQSLTKRVLASEARIIQWFFQKKQSGKTKCLIFQFEHGVLLKTGRHAAAHPGGHTRQYRLGGGSFRIGGEDTRTRTGHSCRAKP